jgi:hypothetical protein
MASKFAPDGHDSAQTDQELKRSGKRQQPTAQSTIDG